MKAIKCEMTGCKGEVKWVVRKLWGKGGTIHTCDRHKPGGRPLPEHLKPKRPFYDIRPIGEGEAR